MKKILVVCLIMVAFLSLSAVAAHENATDSIPLQDANATMTTDDVSQPKKIDLEAKIIYPDEVSYVTTGNEEDYELLIEGVDHSTHVDIFIDKKHAGDYYDEYNERYVLYPDGLSLGEHVISAKFNGDDTYNPFYINKTFKVARYLIDIPDVITPSRNSVLVKIADNAEGTVTIYANNTKIKTASLEKGNTDGTIITIDNLKFGTYDIKLVYSGDGKYPKTTKSKRVNVSFDMDFAHEYCDNGASTNVVLPIDATGMPVAKVGNEFLNVTKVFEDTHAKTSTFYIDYFDLKPGTHVLEVTYPGDDRYPSRTIRDSIRLLTGIKINEFLNVNETCRIGVKLPEDAKGNLTVKLNNEFYATERPNVWIDLPNLHVGVYNLSAEYTGDDYIVEAFNDDIDVMPVLRYPSEMTYGDSETCFIDYMEDINTTIMYSDYDDLNGKVRIVNGKGNFSLQKFKIDALGGINPQNIYFFCPSSSADNVTAIMTILIKPVKPKLTGAKGITMYYGDSRTISVRIVGDTNEFKYGGAVAEVKIGAKRYFVDPKNDLIRLKIDEKPGKYEVEVTYLGAKTVKKLTVKQPLKLKVASIRKSAKKLTLKATLKKGKTPLSNKKITFKFNGKKYVSKTDSKGVAKAVVKSNVLKRLKVGKKVTYQAAYGKDTIKRTSKVKR